MKIMRYYSISCRKQQKTFQKIFAFLILLWYNVMVYISVIIPYTIFKRRLNCCLKRKIPKSIFGDFRERNVHKYAI